jgi:hypothetical protein
MSDERKTGDAKAQTDSTAADVLNDPLTDEQLAAISAGGGVAPLESVSPVVPVAHAPAPAPTQTLPASFELRRGLK